MANPFVREIGTVTTRDGEADDYPVTVGVDYGLVTIRFAGRSAGLSAARAADFARLFVQACWEAAAQAEAEDAAQ